LNVVGQVVNTGNLQPSFTEVVGAFYNISGGLIGVGDTYADPDTLAGNQPANFHID